MSLSKPFPLLHLPRLPLLNVFNHMGVEELFCLSICSKKTKYAIKLYTIKQRFSVTFYFADTFAFFLKSTNSELLLNVQTHSDIFASIWRFSSSVDVSGTPFEKNVKRLLLFLLDVFNTLEIRLVFEVTRHDFVIGFINFIHSMKLNIQSLKIKSNKEEDVELILDNYRDISSEILLACPTIPGFKGLNKPLSSKARLDKLRMNHAEWVTTWHLTNSFIDCKRLALDKCSTDNIKVNQLIKEWVNGSSQLKYGSLALTFDKISMLEILVGIPSTLVTTTGTRWARFTGRANRIEQQKTGARAYVIRDNRTIVITDSL